MAAKKKTASRKNSPSRKNPAPRTETTQSKTQKKKRKPRRGTKARKARESAKGLKERLDIDGFRDACRPTQADLDELDRLISGLEKRDMVDPVTGKIVKDVRLPIRNLSGRVKALELKLGYGVGRPPQQLDLTVTKPVQVTIVEDDSVEP